MKNLTTLSLITATIIGLTGCGGGNSSPSSSSSGETQNNTAYIAFSNNTTKRLDVLYKTDGTTTGTLELSNIMLPTNSSQYDYELLTNFLIYGDNLYMDKIQKTNNCFFSCVKTEELITNISSEITTITGRDALSFPLPSTIKRSITPNGMYISYRDTSDTTIMIHPKYKISKVSNSGIVTTILNSTSYVPNAVTAQVKINDTMYFSAQDYTKLSNLVNTQSISSYAPSYGLLKLDTDTDIITHIPSVDGFGLLEMYELNGKLYAFGEREVLLGGIITLTKGLYIYNPATPNTSPNELITYATPVSNGQVINGKLYYLAATSSVPSKTLYELNPNNNNITAHASGININNFKNIFQYNSEIYYNDGSAFYKLDGTQIATLPDSQVYQANGKLYFAGDNGSGVELLQYDGTSVSMVLDINVGIGDSTPRNVTERNGNIIFQASADGVSNKLYEYDGATLTMLN